MPNPDAETSGTICSLAAGLEWSQRSLNEVIHAVSIWPFTLGQVAPLVLSGRNCTNTSLVYGVYAICSLKIVVHAGTSGAIGSYRKNVELVNHWCCGGACSPHLPEVSRHNRVVVKAFASGQCGHGLIPGWSISWSDPNNPPKW